MTEHEGAPKVRKGRPPGASSAVLHRGLDNFVKRRKEMAEKVVVSDQRLARWYEVQCKAVEEKANKLGAALEANNANLTGPKDPNWKRYWHLDARYRYVYDTLVKLRQVGHVLVCPNDGIDGVDLMAEMADADCMDIPEPAEFYEGLAYRGMLSGDKNQLQWHWHCEKCQRETIIAQQADNLRKEAERELSGD